MPRYPVQFRKKAVSLASKYGANIAAEQLQVSASALMKWIEAIPAETETSSPAAVLSEGFESIQTIVVQICNIKSRMKLLETQENRLRMKLMDSGVRDMSFHNDIYGLIEVHLHERLLKASPAELFRDFGDKAFSILRCCGRDKFYSFLKQNLDPEGANRKIEAYECGPTLPFHSIIVERLSNTIDDAVE